MRPLKGASMNATNINASSLTHTAISALMDAYEICNDKEAQKSIITAYKAVMMLNPKNGKDNSDDETTESQSGFDESEYCAAV